MVPFYFEQRLYPLQNCILQRHTVYKILYWRPFPLRLYGQNNLSAAIQAR